MKKIKYQFDRETLSFKKIDISFKDMFFKTILPQSIIAIIFGAVLFLLLNLVIESPLERELREDQNNLLIQYELLNKEMNSSSLQLASMQQRDDDVYRKIFQADAVPSSVRKAGFGGIDKYAYLTGFQNSDIVINTAQQIDLISRQLVVQSKSYDEVIDLVKNKEKMLASMPAIQPISNKDLTRFGSPFGYRMHPILGYLKMHAGVDLTAPTGTNIYAPGDGVVIRADAGSRGYGNHVRINHGYGYITVYGHLSKINVRVGQKVKRGDVIGLVGSTGLSTSPHLHYEVRINNKPVNPLNFYYNDLTDEEFDKMIAMSANANTHIFE